MHGKLPLGPRQPVEGRPDMLLDGRCGLWHGKSPARRPWRAQGMTETIVTEKTTKKIS
jgi:hypothetical protein